MYLTDKCQTGSRCARFLRQVDSFCTPVITLKVVERGVRQMMVVVEFKLREDWVF